MSNKTRKPNRKIITERCGTYSVAEAAELLGFGARAVRQALQSGEIPTVRLGGVSRIPKAWVERQLSGETQKQEM